MKYTRYDLKANKKKNEWKTMPILIILVCILAVVIGTLIFKVVYPKIAPKNGTKNIVNKNDVGSSKEPSTDGGETPLVVQGENKTEDKAEKASAGENEEFVTVQFGYYSSKENADKVKSEIGDTATVIKDGEKYRVIGYIGKEANANKYIETIKSSGAESSKGRFGVPKNESCNKKIIELTNAFVDIIDKVKDSEVKAIKTVDFKEWTKKLEASKEEKNSEVLANLKAEVEKLPDSISKSNIESSYQIIFNLLNKFK